MFLNTRALLATSPKTLTSTGNRTSQTMVSYRPCPLCSERIIVRMHGFFVHKWINAHFANRHYEHMHVIVNLRDGQQR